MKEYSHSKPIIGVTTKFGDVEWVTNHTSKYIDVVNEFGGIGVALAPDAPAVFPDGTTYAPDAAGRLPRAVLAHVDGLVLAGGGDVHPSFFDAEMDGANPKSISLPRDELELGLTKAALDTDLPIFGICRGCQVLNVAAGGGMVQHFDGHRSPRENPFHHDVLIEQNSRLFAIVGAERLPTNTYHHQGVDQEALADLFTPTGIVADDPWLIEAFESDHHPWVIGVQWHPERLYELSADHRKLWAAFVEACRARKAGASFQDNTATQG